jgi:hypothetical protein
VYIVAVTATDAAGNISSPALATFAPSKPIHLVFAPGDQLLIDAQGDLRVKLGSIAHNAKGTLSLRLDSKTLASTKFRVAKGKSTTIVLRVSSAARRDLLRHPRLSAHLVVSLIAGDGQVAHASTTIKLLANAAAVHRADAFDDLLGPLESLALL